MKRRILQSPVAAGSRPSSRSLPISHRQCITLAHRCSLDPLQAPSRRLVPVRPLPFPCIGRPRTVHHGIMLGGAVAAGRMIGLVWSTSAGAADQRRLPGYAVAHPVAPVCPAAAVAVRPGWPAAGGLCPARPAPTATSPRAASQPVRVRAGTIGSSRQSTGESQWGRKRCISTWTTCWWIFPAPLATSAKTYTPLMPTVWMKCPASSH